jgi:hypothetical protein
MKTNKKKVTNVTNALNSANDTVEIDFDGTWKAIITEFFEDFMAFFLPDLHALIDYPRGVTFLEQELQHLVELFSYKKKVSDKLVKVFLKNGAERWLLIHLEVQSYFELEFNKRMFLLYSWIFGKYEKEIVTLVVYTGTANPKEFNVFQLNTHGTELRYKFNTYRVMLQDNDKLLASDNIFALFVLANKYTNETRGEENYLERLELKEKLFQLALAKQINLDKIMRLLIFVHQIMQLPDGLKPRFNEFLKSKVNALMAQVSTFSLNKSYEDFALIFTELIHGENYQVMMQKQRVRHEQELKKARAEAKKARQEAEKTRQEAEMRSKQRINTILKLFHLKSWTVEQIAEMMELEVDVVKNLIQNNQLT